MKSTLFIFFAMFIQSISAQDTLGKLSIHFWAGGQCCSNGTDYAFEGAFMLPTSEIDSVKLTFDGISLTLNKEDLAQFEPIHSISPLLKFGHSNNDMGYPYQNDTSIYYGFDKDRFQLAKTYDKPIAIFLKSGKVISGKLDITETLTAYP